MANLTRISAIALLTAGLPVAAVTAADATTTAAPTASPSVYAVTVTAQTGILAHGARGLLNLGAHTADLTSRLRDGQMAEVRVVGGEAFARLGPHAPWLSVDPSSIGIPLSALWDVADARAATSQHFSVTVGRKNPVTITVNLSAAVAGRSVKAPSAAVNVTQYLRELRHLARNN